MSKQNVCGIFSEISCSYITKNVLDCSSFSIKDMHSLSEPKEKCPDLEVVILKNLSIETNVDNNWKHFSGKTYILHFDNYFYHQLQEIICQFDFIKKYIPDIKLMFMDRYSKITQNLPDLFFEEIKNWSFSYKNDFTKNINTHKYFEDFYKIYLKEAHDENIYSLANNNFTFDEVYLITDVVSFIPIELFQEHDFTPVWKTKKFIDNAYCVYSQMNPVSLKLYRERINQYVYTNDALPKKIYISREDANKRYQYVDNDKITYHSQEYRNFAKMRTYPKEHVLIEYFKNKGYEIVNFEGTSYIDQIQVLHNATHIAGLIGSGFLNILSCQPKTKIFEIHMSTKYDFAYKFVSDVFNLDHNVINLKLLNDSDPEDIIKELDKFDV